MNGYQWTVIFAAWLGWGFDVFDGLLFNYVAPNCVPTLLGLKIGSAEAKSATLQWTGILTSVLLIGWAVGGVIFGKVADKIGRTKTLLLTMLLYAIGTAACAFAPNIWFLAGCRVVASLGHRRRMGGGRGDGCRSRAGKKACRSGRTALYFRADGFVSGDVSDVSNHGRLFQRSGGFVAICFFVRLDSGGGRISRAHFYQRTGTLETGRGQRNDGENPRTFFAAVYSL